MYVVYHEKVVLESCLWRGYVPAGKSYSVFASFSPKSYPAAAAESESAKQELHTTLQHLQRQY